MERWRVVGPEELMRGEVGAEAGRRAATGAEAGARGASVATAWVGSAELEGPLGSVAAAPAAAEGRVLTGASKGPDATRGRGAEAVAVGVGAGRVAARLAAAVETS